MYITTHPYSVLPVVPVVVVVVVSFTGCPVASPPPPPTFLSTSFPAAFASFENPVDG